VAKLIDTPRTKCKPNGRELYTLPAKPENFSFYPEKEFQK
jgi:hypothetical protein